MNSLNITAWSKKIALIVQSGNRVVLELEDASNSNFSPLLFENSLFVETLVSRDSDIHSIGIINDSLPGNYGKNYLYKYFMDEF